MCRVAMCAGNMLPGGIVYHCDTSSMISSCAVLVSHNQTTTFPLCGGGKVVERYTYYTKRYITYQV